MKVVQVGIILVTLSTKPTKKMKKSIAIFIYPLTLFFVSCTQPAGKINSEQNNSVTIYDNCTIE